jgi:hypothetical protein
MKSNLNLLHFGNKMFVDRELNDKKQTKFGIWYYNADLYSSFISYKKIEPYFDDYYKVYKAYLSKYNEPTKKSFFSNNKAKKMSELTEILTLVDKKSIKLIELVEFFKSELVLSYQDFEKSDVVKLGETEITSQTDDATALTDSVEQIDYEKKLFTELAKVKRKLKNEYRDEIEEIKNKEVADQKTKKDDLDDERRRILG